MNCDVGYLPGEFPYARAGDGSRPLVVVPGFGDAMHPGPHPPATAWLLGSYYWRFRDDRAVYLLSRPRGFPEGYTIPEMARDHARVFEATFGDRPADVLGLSMGGMIAQALAAEHPEVVNRVVLGVTGYHTTAEGRESVRRWKGYARDRDWAAIRSELAAGMFSDWRALAYPPVIRTAARPFLPRPADPTDVLASLEAIEHYVGEEAAGRLSRIEAPTLVIGGERDPYFPATVLQETAAAIPDAAVHVIPGAKHGAFHDRKNTFDRRVAGFLDG